MPACGARPRIDNAVPLGLSPLVCDREVGHDGEHRGYDDTIDEPIFWRAQPNEETHMAKKKQIEARHKFEIYRDHSGEWRWRLRNRNGKILADSGESYKERSKCRIAVNRTRTVAAAARIEVLAGEQWTKVPAK